MPLLSLDKNLCSLKKKLDGLSYSQNMGNFEAFQKVISSNICLLFQKSVAEAAVCFYVHTITI